VWVSININIIAQPEGKAQCVKNRFADLTILRFCLQAKFAPFTRLEWMERIFSEYFPHLIRPCDKKARSSFLKVWDYPLLS